MKNDTTTTDEGIVNVAQLATHIIPAFSDEVLLSMPAHEAADFKRYRLIPQALLVNAPWNYKEEDLALTNKLANNLKNQGQTENINVRPLETGYFQVGNGNHRNSIFERQGRQYVLCCVHEGISEAEFKRRCIEQNETKFATNTMKLAGLIKELSAEFDGLEELADTMPFTADELSALATMTDHDWDAYGQHDGDGGEHTDDGNRVIKLLVPKEVYDLWLDYAEKYGQEDHAKAFWFAIQQAMAVPDKWK